MKMCHRIWILVLTCLLALPVYSQRGNALPQASSPPPQPEPRQARSMEELEAYQQFLKETDPDRQIRLVEDFLLEYPNTELKEQAFQEATKAYQAKNDYARLLTYGELTLAENENNLAALLILASAIPERTRKDDPDREENLAAAEDYAKRALEVLAGWRRPPSIFGGQRGWEQTRNQAEATARAALGLIAIIRGDFVKAGLELEKAANSAVRPDPILLYRLGLCYSFQKKYDEALAVFDRAAASGGVQISDPAGRTRDLVAEAKQYARKAKAALETPGSPPASTQDSMKGSP